MAQCEAQSMRRARETVGRAVLRPRSRRRHRHRREPARRPASQPLCRSMAVCKKEQGPLPPRANRLTAMTSLDAGTLVCASKLMLRVSACSGLAPLWAPLPRCPWIVAGKFSRSTGHSGGRRDLEPTCPLSSEPSALSSASWGRSLQDAFSSAPLHCASAGCQA